MTYARNENKLYWIALEGYQLANVVLGEEISCYIMPWQHKLILKEVYKIRLSKLIFPQRVLSFCTSNPIFRFLICLNGPSRYVSPILHSLLTMRWFSPEVPICTKMGASGENHLTFCNLTFAPVSARIRSGERPEYKHS